jgi:hypothetical protein
MLKYKHNNMGQYFKIIFLSENGDIRIFINPSNYKCGAKILEHSYVGSNLLKVVAFLLSPEGMMYKSRIVWAGDYAEPEPNDENDENLYHIADQDVNMFKQYINPIPDVAYCRYIVNHTKRFYVDADETHLPLCTHEDNWHPLPFLIFEGETPLGGTDDHLYGIWSRDVISMERTVPKGYEQLKCEFRFF